MRIIVYAKTKDQLIKEPLTSDAKSPENKGTGNKIYEGRSLNSMCLSFPKLK